MNVWMTEDSMLHMKTKSVISGSLISKKDFECQKSSSALSVAERQTVEYVSTVGEKVKMEMEVKKEGENEVSKFLSAVSACVDIGFFSECTKVFRLLLSDTLSIRSLYLISNLITYLNYNRMIK